jgi:hypothetical protein
MKLPKVRKKWNITYVILKETGDLTVNKYNEKKMKKLKYIEDEKMKGHILKNKSMKKVKRAQNIF